MDISERLYLARKKAGLSQEEVAFKIGVSRQAVSNWERGESMPDTANLISFARACGTTLTELAGDGISSETEAAEQKAGCDELSAVSNGADNSETIQSNNGEVGGFWAVLPFPIIIVVAYLLMGFLGNLWHPGWIVFFAIPLYYGLLAAFNRLKRKKGKNTNASNN